MKITDYLNESLIISDLDGADKNTVLKKFSDCVSQQFPKIPADEVFTILKEREDLGSTGIGDSIAIPHGKTKKTETLIVAFAHSHEGISFDAIDDQPVKFFFLLLAPEDSAGLHLKALAKISRMLKDQEFRKRLAEAKDATELFQLIQEKDDQE
ncbi:MAG: PTS sugar transporter subunit IIA [Pseudomonadota bacterium]|nr:PTS sugar transporter subunit IIA [Pseudomonadota bacterium]